MKIKNIVTFALVAALSVTVTQSAEATNVLKFKNVSAYDTGYFRALKDKTLKLPAKPVTDLYLGLISRNSKGCLQIQTVSQGDLSFATKADSALLTTAIKQKSVPKMLILPNEFHVYRNNIVGENGWAHPINGGVYYVEGYLAAKQLSIVKVPQKYKNCIPDTSSQLAFFDAEVLTLIHPYLN